MISIDFVFCELNSFCSFTVQFSE